MNLSQDCTTKLFRDLCDAHIQSTELEQTSVCRLGVGVSHVLRTWHLADSNILVGRLCLQPQKSHVQMTEPLQTSSACHSNGARAVGTCSRVVHRPRTELGCTSLHSWLRWPRYTQLRIMIEQSPTVFGHCDSQQE